MKHKIILAIALPLFFTSSALAQQLHVLHVGGDVTATVNGASKAVKVKDVITMQTVVNIPYEGSLDLIDEKNSKRYILKKVGKGTVATLSSQKGNTVGDLTARYLTYVKKQLTKEGLVSAQRYSDFATVTREMKQLTMREKFELEKERNRKSFDRFREECNKKYTDFVRQAWIAVKGSAPVQKPVIKKVKPVKFNQQQLDNRVNIKGWVKKLFSSVQGVVDQQKKDQELLAQNAKTEEQTPVVEETETPTVETPTVETPKVEEQKPVVEEQQKPIVEETMVPSITMENTEEQKHNVVIPSVSVNPAFVVKNQPKPIEVIQEVPIPAAEKEFSTMPVTFLGTNMMVRVDETKRVNVGQISPDRVADVLQKFATTDYDNLLKDCLDNREKQKLCDWAYLQMLKTVTDQFCGEGTNEATLLLGYLFYQSGYKVRFAHDDNDKIYLLYGTNHVIYGKSYFNFDGVNFYPLDETMPEQIYMCKAQFPNEKNLSLLIPESQNLYEDISADRNVSSIRYADFTLKYTSNKELMKFYNDYPSSYVDDNFMTRWAMIANTPLNDEMKTQLYPQLKKRIEGKSEVEACNILLSLFGDTTGPGYNYGLDDEVWGGDRAFYAEETLFYPYCDCEDRAILFTRLVRDLLGLKCVLVYYPGHLACAVHFNSEVQGDTYVLDGVNYTVTDPTYVGAGVGEEMPMNDNSATLVLLQ